MIYIKLYEYDPFKHKYIVNSNAYIAIKSIISIEQFGDTDLKKITMSDLKGTIYVTKLTDKEIKSIVSDCRDNS